MFEKYSKYFFIIFCFQKAPKLYTNSIQMGFETNVMKQDLEYLKVQLVREGE